MLRMQPRNKPVPCWKNWTFSTVWKLCFQNISRVFQCFHITDNISILWIWTKLWKLDFSNFLYNISNLFPYYVWGPIFPVPLDNQTWHTNGKKGFQSWVFILAQLHFGQCSCLPFCLPSLIVQWPATHDYEAALLTTVVVLSLLGSHWHSSVPAYFKEVSKGLLREKHSAIRTRSCKLLAATKASKVWFSYSRNCTLANGAFCLPSLIVQWPTRILYF